MAKQAYDYKLVQSSDEATFENIVKGRLLDGWLLHGSLVITYNDGDAFYTRELIKYK